MAMMSKKKGMMLMEENVVVALVAGQQQLERGRARTHTSLSFCCVVCKCEERSLCFFLSSSLTHWGMMSLGYQTLTVSSPDESGARR